MKDSEMEKIVVHLEESIFMSREKSYNRGTNRSEESLHGGMNECRESAAFLDEKRAKRRR